MTILPGINLCSTLLSVGQKCGFVTVMDLTKLVWCQATDKLGTLSWKSCGMFSTVLERQEDNNV